MNFKLVFKQLGLLFFVLSGFLGAVAVWSLLFGDRGENSIDEGYAGSSLLSSAAIAIVIGGLTLLALRRTAAHLGRREALLLVALSWLLGAAISALPFFLWAHLEGARAAEHPFRSFIDCYFEAMSGLTTTGATILSDIESVPRGLLLWRSLTHWLGGLGIVVLFVAVLPSLGVGGKRLFRIEAPGPEPEGVHPQIRDTARMLWYVYFGLTIAEILALNLIGKMPLFDSVCHTFGTLATGGFSTKNASIGAYSGTVQLIIILFMVLAGANFGLYYQLLRRRWKSVYRDVELRVYLALLGLGAALVIGTLWFAPAPMVTTEGSEVVSDFGASVREGLFTTVSIQTTTGFATSDFNRWPFLAQAVLVMLMFVGGSAGSTSGGIKVIRVWVALKVMAAELERAFRPSVIRPVRVAGANVDPDLKLGTLAYVAGIAFLFVLGSGVVMLLEQLFNPEIECSFTSASTATIATLCTIGPGLARVGAIENYGWFSDASKIVLCLLMAIGRLEIFAILVLFTPKFWRGN